MSHSDLKPDLARRSGFLAWAAQNTVAANLLMLMIIGGGALAMWSLTQEVFPEVDTDRITVNVPYLGATPAEVEEGVVMRVEEALAGIEGVKRLRSTSSEGMGTVVVELEDYASNSQVLNDVESAVARIDTFPQETERPVIAEVSNQIQVLSLVIHGDVPEATLKTLAGRTRDDLTAKDNISVVNVGGMRQYEISIETSEAALRRYNMSFEQVAEAVAGSSVDLPGGAIKTEGGEILLRTTGQRYIGREFEDIIVMSRPDGTAVRLSDVAEVRDTFEDSDVAMYFDGERAAVLNVFAVGEQDSLDVAGTVKQYVEAERNMLPAGVEMDTWFDRSIYLQERIDLLTRNAYIGLLLVFLCLTLFLDLRLALWTTMGIPISFFGAFFLLPYFDVTINMISLFAFIVVLGIVVDDAIVVGENIFEKREQGLGAIDAAIVGVREMAAPVTFAILTTVVAFLPLLFTTGQMGKIMRDIPIVVIFVLLMSLIEALIILPAHLTGRDWQMKKPGPLARVQGRVRNGLHRFVHGPYVALVRRAVAWRYATLAGAIAILMITGGYVAGGHIKFIFMPDVDADNVVAQLEMPQGTPAEQTARVVKRLENALHRVRQQVDADKPEDAPSVVKHVSSTIGQQPFADAAAHVQRGTGAAGGQAHLAEVNAELISGATRGIPSATFGAMWREEVGDIAGISSLEFTTTIMTLGEPINVEMTHRDFDTLLLAVEDLKNVLNEYQGVGDISDSFVAGKPEIQFQLTEAGRAAGLTLRDVAQQVRQGFYGEEVQRVQRGREDMRVMVRYPESQRQSLADLENMRIRLPQSNIDVPLATVASTTIDRGFAEISRADRRRIVSVTADVDAAVANATQINNDLRQNVLPALLAEYPGLNFSFEGEQREQADSLRSLYANFAIALLAIFALLGVQFRSYVQPLIVMTAIPFGLVGAVLGHVIMGLNLSFLSGFGVVALTGVVVNDSLIMIDLINKEREAGVPLHRVIIDCGVRRFRPILLTTLTTFFGLTPMLLETSVQAKFLVP
ncbi:MAG: efflux RND transporter permease subunit, partial [Phycisphaeraceae bacterium]